MYDYYKINNELPNTEKLKILNIVKNKELKIKQN